MKQSGRREFLRLMAGAAASGSAFELLLRQTGSQSLASGRIGNPKPQAGHLRVGLISDLNSSYGSTSYGASVERGVNLLLQEKPDLVICAGDMVAGQKRRSLTTSSKQCGRALKPPCDAPCRKPAFHFCRRWGITTHQANDLKAAGSMPGNGNRPHCFGASIRMRCPQG